jgi:DNA (cytosine-5)-methyltransferase 1
MMDERISRGDDAVQCLAETSASVTHPSEIQAAAAPVKTGVKGLDLFAGAGGFSLGAIAAGVDIVGALEFHKHASATYEANVKRKNDAKVAVIKEDILTVSPAEAMRRWSLTAGGIDIVIGGPPCQGFSSHRINDAGVDDPRNKLLGRYFEYVEAIRPRIFLVENVPGLLWERHKTYLKAFYARGDAAEYDLSPAKVINARDFGVPQNRRRVFILGIDRRRPLDIAWPPQATHVSPSVVEPERNGRETWRTAKEVFRPARDNDPNDIHMQHSADLVALFAKTPANGGSRSESGRVLKCHEGYNGHSDVYGRIDPARPGPTMTTACINPSKGRFVHPTEHHGITLRQAARLQTFPEDFIFGGGLMSGGEQIGNAVPVTLATALLKPLVAALGDPAKR